MKTNKTLTCSLFLITCSLAALTVSAAGSYWASVNTTEYRKGDPTPSTEKAGQYAAYYCTQAAAQKMFGKDATTVDAINDYLSKNFNTGKTAMGKTEGSVAIDQSGYYEMEQYTFIEYFSDAIAAGDYFAVTFYQDRAFRVFGKDNAVLKDGNLVFDDQAAGMVGGWVTVPEPTGGVLLLLGFATLGLRRKRG